jgi:hypothetical protein
MPSPDPNRDQSLHHIQEASDNYARYQMMSEQDRDLGWAVTLLFYSALHLVQAHAERHCTRTPSNPFPVDHQSRDPYVANNLPEVAHEYTRLYNASMDGRYRLKKFTMEDVQRYHDQAYVVLRDKMYARLKINTS